jgi:glutamine amidotransferase
MGWNQVHSDGGLQLLAGIPPGAHFYFVHSYYPVPAQVSDAMRVAWCEYGVRFAAAIERGRVFATQFHPEKSQRWGLRLLENFAAAVKGGG